MTDKDFQEEEITIEPENEETTFSGKPKKDQDKIQKLQTEKQEYLDGWQRARAELANLKNQHAEEKKLFTELGKQSLLQDLIPMLDNFDAAFADKDAWEQTPEGWRVGIEYIYNQFKTVLEENGVQVYGEVGEQFDTALYEPVEMVSDPENAGKVIQVIQKGYKLKDRVVRPAKVKVAE